MVHHGHRIEIIAAQKGLRKSNLARLLDKTHQAISYDFGRQTLSSEVLHKYASVLQVNVNELQKEENETPVFTEDYLSKYLKAVEKIDFLQSVLLKNGIKVEMPGFRPGVPVSDFGQLNIFFDKGVQKRIHP